MESFPRTVPTIRSIYKLRLCLRVGSSGLPRLLPFGAPRGRSRGCHLSLDMLHDSSLCGVHFRIPNNRSLSDVTRGLLCSRLRTPQCASVMESHQSVQFSCSPGCSKVAAVLSMSEMAIFRQLTLALLSVHDEQPHTPVQRLSGSRSRKSSNHSQPRTIPPSSSQAAAKTFE